MKLFEVFDKAPASLDIPRDQMPQISRNNLGNHDTKKTQLPVHGLTPCQQQRVPGLTDQTIEQIQKRGKVKPLIVDRDGRIVNGHHRWDACKQLGIKSVPVIQVQDATVWDLIDKFSHTTSDEFAEADDFAVNREMVNEVPLPQDWDSEKMNAYQSFDNRLQYALDRAEEIGTGSSRVAMIIEYEGRPTVLKVARSKQGLVQNEQEIKVLKNSRVAKSPMVIPLVDYDQENSRPVWIQTELAQEVSESALNQIFRTPDLKFLIEYVDFKSGKSGIFVWTKTANKKRQEFDTKSFSEIKKIYLENTKYTDSDWQIFEKYADQLVHLVYNTRLETGDFRFDENWGMYGGHPVIIDLGFTDTTREYY